VQRNAKASAAVLLLCSFALAITIPFLYNKPAPPTGKWIHIQFTCSQSGKPIYNLPVTIGTETHLTDQDGWVLFGSGFAPGTYTYEWVWWDGPHSEEVTIDCSQEHWYFYESLMNPEVHKWFYVDSVHAGYPPIEGLEVTLVGYGTQKTDSDGYVEWIVDYPFTDTELTWTWNGAADSEPVKWADFVGGIWEKENGLDPKGGGGINLHLAEERG